MNKETEEREKEIKEILSNVIAIRNKTTFPTNYYVVDEDVNVYLSHLLWNINTPEWTEMCEPYLGNTDDVLQWVKATEDRTIRYFIFKINADNLLAHLSGVKPNAIFATRTINSNSELCKLYYDQAHNYYNRIYKKTDGVGSVLQKLNTYFNDYLPLLTRINLVYYQDYKNNLLERKFEQFTKDFHDYDRKINETKRMDELLDVYNQYKKNPLKEFKDKLMSLIEEEKKNNPNFNFKNIPG